MARPIPVDATQPGSDMPRLLLVYNADAGIINAARESFLKVFAPDRQACSLCALTYGLFTMHGEWRAFLNALPIMVEELHRDEFAALHPERGIALPAILIEGAGEVMSEPPQVLISADDLDALGGLDDLIAIVRARLAGESLSAV